jgi:hypothetical protein
VENVNAQVDALIQTGALRRLLAFTELKFSNSMIEAWWRSLKHQCLFLDPLTNSSTVRRLVAFYVDEHNRVLPHAFRGQTPDEMYFGADNTDAGRPGITRGRGAPGTNGSTPIRVVRDMPVSRRRRVTIVPATATRRPGAFGGQAWRIGDRT